MNTSTRFALALRAAGLSLNQWIAREIDPVVSERFVWKVLAGTARSARVEQAIQRTIREQSPRIARAFRTAA